MTGTVWRGTVGLSDTLHLLPANEPVRIRRLQSQGKDVERVHAGERAAINLAGIKATAMGRRLYHPLVSEHLDPRGKPYFWIGGAHQSFDPSEGTDGYWFERGYATITPLRPNLTDHDSLRRIEGWPLDRTKGTT